MLKKVSYESPRVDEYSWMADSLFIVASYGEQGEAGGPLGEEEWDELG